MKVFLGHLDWGLGTEGTSVSDSTTMRSSLTYFWCHILHNFSFMNPFRMQDIITKYGLSRFSSNFFVT